MAKSDICSVAYALGPLANYLTGDDSGLYHVCSMLRIYAHTCDHSLRRCRSHNT